MQEVIHQGCHSERVMGMFLAPVLGGWTGKLSLLCGPGDQKGHLETKAPLLLSEQVAAHNLGQL